MGVQYRMLSKFYDLLDVIYFHHDETNPRKALLDFVSDRETKVLDLCIGTGANSIEVAENRINADVIGIDLSEAMLTLAQEKIERKGITHIKTFVMDATNLNFEDNSFDVVIMSLILHEVSNITRDRIMAEAERVLKNTGKLLVIEWDQPHKLSQKLLFSLIKSFEPKGFREFLKLSIREYVKKFSLQVVQERKCDYTRVFEIVKRR